MIYLKIADLVIEADGFDYEYFVRRTSEYVCEKCEPDVKVGVELCDSIDIPNAECFAKSGIRHYAMLGNDFCFYDVYNDKCIALIKADENWKNVTAFLTDVSSIGGADNDIRRFFMLGEVFGYCLLWNDGIAYHSSTISHKNKGVIFTASSGTGKSTHTGLWVKYYGDDTEIINDDTPALRFIDGTPYLYGTPWSGKTEINKNVRVPAVGIVFLQRGETNSIRRISGVEGYRMLISGVMVLPFFEQAMNRLLAVLEKAAATIPTYVLYCNISREAVDTVKNEIFE